MAKGVLYGVGVGPGDPELITVKAQRIICSVPVVVVPVKAAGEKSFAYSIVEQYLEPGRQKILELVFPMTKDAAVLEPYWQKAAQEIRKKLQQGLDCAFLTEGDPFIYSTFIDIFQILSVDDPDIGIEVIPGISSFTAAAARSLTPLIDGDERMAILPATFEGGRLRQTLRDFDTVVLFKVHSVFDNVLAMLEEEGLAENAVVVTRCTGENEVIERDVRLLKGRKLNYFSLVIVRRKS